MAARIEAALADEHCEVRVRATELLADAPLPLYRLKELIAGAADDSSVLVRAAAAAALAKVLRRADGLARTSVIAEWAVSSSWQRRAAIARALCCLDAVAALSAVEHLAKDEVCEVRRAAVESAACHLEEASQRCVAVLRAAAVDSDVSIRLVAIAGLRKASELGYFTTALPTLASCAESSEVRVASAARAVIDAAAITAPNEVTIAYEELLAQAIAAHDVALVENAVVVLRRLRAGAPVAAAAALRRITGHPSRWVRDAVAQAIGTDHASPAPFSPSALQEPPQQSS